MMSSKTKQYEMDMCSGPILRKMLMFALPLMLSSILQLLFNAADIVVVGKFAGDNSLAAVGSNTALINLLTNLFIGLSIGANVVAARHYGAKAWDDLRRTVHTAMLLSMLSGALLLVLGVIGAEQMLIWMQTPEEVLPLATVYLRIYFLGMISTMVYNFGSALLRAVGDTKRPLYFLLCAGVINVILNLLFVIGFQMDVMGVAIATVISETVSALLVLRCLVKEKGGIHLELRAMRIDRKKMLQILRIGLPAGFQGVVFALSNVVIQSSVNIFGNIVVAGNSAAANLEGFVYMAMNAFYQTTLSFVSQNYGAGKQKRINRIVLLGEACGSDCRRNGAPALYFHDLCPMRHHGRDGRRTAWHRLFHYADDCFYCGRVCIAADLAGDGVPDSGVPQNRNGLSVLSGHLDPDQSGLHCLFCVDLHTVCAKKVRSVCSIKYMKRRNCHEHIWQPFLFSHKIHTRKRLTCHKLRAIIDW